MTNRCAYQHNALGAFGGENTRMGDSISVSDGVVCPKPRRLCLLNPSFNHQTEVSDSRAGMELLDMILMKGSYGAERPNSQVPSSPPFFCGSPPSRASNPVIQDALFGNDKPSSSSSSPTREASSSPSTRKNGGCVRVQFGNKPAAVRIEGFNCHGSCSISAVA